MIGMLVRDENGGNLPRVFAQPAQTFERLAPGKTGIHQNAG